jgi:hypothetical protein
MCASTVLEFSCSRIHRYVAAPVGHWHGWDVGREAERQIGGTSERQEAGSQSAGR